MPSTSAQLQPSKEQKTGVEEPGLEGREPVFTCRSAGASRCQGPDLMHCSGHVQICGARGAGNRGAHDAQALGSGRSRFGLVFVICRIVEQPVRFGSLFNIFSSARFGYSFFRFGLLLYWCLVMCFGSPSKSTQVEADSDSVWRRFLVSGRHANLQVPR